MTDLNDYVDLGKQDPNLQSYTCWNCGHEGQDRASKSESAIICTECFHGQGEDKTDYIDLWYPQLPREKAIELQKQRRAETRREANQDRITVKL